MLTNLFSSKRYKWMLDCLTDSFEIPSKSFNLDDVLRSEGFVQELRDFFEGRGPPKLMFYYQEPSGADETSEGNHLFLTHGDTEPLRSKAVYFLRLSEKGRPVSLNDLESDIIFGEIVPQCLDQLLSVMTNVFQPQLEKPETLDWGSCDEEQKKDLLSQTGSFTAELEDCFKSMNENRDKCRVDQAALANIQIERERGAYMENLFETWVQHFQAKFKRDEEEYRNIASQGPQSEITYWKKLLNETTLMIELTKSADFVKVKGELNAQSKKGEEKKSLAQYKVIETQLADKLNEAKDNVKYLNTLQNFIDPLYNGKIEEIIEILPSMMNAIKMIHTISRYFNTSQRMNSLLTKITNQLITNCRNRIQKPSDRSDAIWNTDSETLIKLFESVISLGQKYRSSYEATKRKASELPKSRHWDFDETAIFQKFDLFVKRIKKLIDLFQTIQQFRLLEKHSNLEGMENLTKKFNKHLDDFKKKTPNLLDFENVNMEKNYVELMQKIQKLDTDLQDFIDSNFSKIKNISYSLKLLKKFETILCRENVLNKLMNKHEYILQNYGAEIDTIQNIFDSQKANPPIIRNMPVDAGKIVWARHLFFKLYGPIEEFPQNLISTREMKKYIDKFNLICQNLIIYEVYFTECWSKDIERAKACLQTTLLVTKEENGVRTLKVNFEKEIQKLLREAKALDREGLNTIPESAKIILLQEEKFKRYYYELDFIKTEYERVIMMIKPIVKTLLQPHVEDLNLKLQPAIATLTWTSMNIDNFIEKMRKGISRLEQLIVSINDFIENRIENSLKMIGKIILVKLPQDSKTMSLDEFVKSQQIHIDEKAELLISKNIEIERSVDDLLHLISAYMLDPSVEQIDTKASKTVKQYFFWYFYQALLNSTQKSLNMMKDRICGKKGIVLNEQDLGSAGPSSQTPFFEVNLILENSEVRLVPSLEDIQRSINKAATAVLSCSKNMLGWDQVVLTNAEDNKKESYYKIIAQDKEIVKVILLLTGSIQGTKNKVNEFLHSFDTFKSLWTDNMVEVIKRFHNTNPQLQDYEDKLKEFTLLEGKIEAIERNKVIGAMALKTDALVDALKVKCKEWKKKYCDDLHTKARDSLAQLTENIKNYNLKMQKEVKDIDSLGTVMTTIEEIKQEQSIIDIRFAPVIDMYHLLDTYLNGGIVDKEEMENRTLLRKKWNELIELTDLRQKELQKEQDKNLKKLKENVKQLIEDVKKLRKNFVDNGPMVEGISPKEASDRLKRFENEYELKYAMFEISRRGENLFGLKNQNYPELEATHSDIKNLDKLYALYNQVNETTSIWEEMAWCDIQVNHFRDWEDMITKYAESCAKLPKGLKDWQAYKVLKEKIENYKKVFPIIKELKEPMIKKRHWEMIKELTGKKDLHYDQPENFFFRELIEANLTDNIEEIEDIIDSAKKQDKIDKTKEEIKRDWNSRQFAFKDWGTKRKIPILSGNSVEEIQEKLEEDISTLSGLSAMRHVGPFKQDLQQLQETLSDIQATLDLWVKVQVLWTSLERVFTEGDISMILTNEAKKFTKIDKAWVKSIMEKANEQKLVKLCCQNEVIKLMLPNLQEDLEQCQKQLEKYLEMKRKAFPRFYFVSNPVLLKFLSQGSDPESVQEDFDKLFDAISKVHFETVAKKSTRKITIIKNSINNDDELLNLTTEVVCADFIEKWLQLLERSMQMSVKDAIKSVYIEISKPSKENPGTLENFIDSFTAQVALVGLQMKWTKLVQEALEKKPGEKNKPMNEAKSEVNKIIDDLTDLCRKDLKTTMRRQKVETLVTIMVYLKEVTTTWKFTSAQDFEWQKYTRIHWRDDLDNCVVTITDWEAPYSNEYLGVKERLCITPLTDRCYISLAQAMSMHYGGAPAGPAGTGKTETVKDMGRTLGIFVVLTNCSKEHRYTDMAKIFKGLCQSGLWGCFDEFNLIELEVLSVVAMQVESITSAKKANLSEFLFTDETEKIKLVPTCGYFITMNPGYAGRQELPENLKVLFRGVTMMVPDREVIIRVKLASCGYKEYNELAKKFKVLYGLCEEQLSKQRHYDFGLRNILSVLRTMGNTLRACKDNRSEEMLMMKSLKDMNISKLVPEDIPLFEALLKDIFPKLADNDKKGHPEMEKRIRDKTEYNQLIPHDSWILKVIQLYETSLVRHGIVLLGPSCSGKSSIINILIEALSMDNKKYIAQKLNPKAFTSQEMYGVKNFAGEWTPGIFSEIWRKANEKKPNKPHFWLICDGPVDSLWIENMNSVLDDNKVLTLANGDRIFMQDTAKLIFEVENLNNASPATVSRCGQIYVSPVDLGYERIVRGWVLQRTKDSLASSKGSTDKFFNKEEGEKVLNILLKYIRDMNIIEVFEKATFKSKVIYIDSALKTLQTLKMLGGLLTYFSTNKNTSKSWTEEDYEKMILFSLMWGIAGSYENKQRLEFTEILMKASDRPLPLPRTGENDLIFDYYLVSEEKGLEWKLIKPEAWKPPAQIMFSRLLMPTIDSTRADLLINLLMNSNSYVLLTGGSGTAKTSSILMYMNKFDREKMLMHRINFSSATQPAHFQTAIESVCETKIRKGFGPKDGKTMTVFIDDMSMPECNKWGDQITLEIVRELVEDFGFYRLERNERGNFKYIENLKYIAAMNHPGGGRNDIPNRLKHHFFILNMILPNRIDIIFDPILKNIFKASVFSQTPEVNKVVDNLSNATIKLWNLMKNSFLPTPSKFHYLFNLRDISRIFKGMCQVKVETIKESLKTLGMRSELFMIALWRHECERVFVDKLMTPKDKSSALSLIRETCLEVYNSFEAELEAHVFAKQIYFCDFMNVSTSEEDQKEEEAKFYSPVDKIEVLRTKANALLKHYNEENPQKKMDLVLFDDALGHLVKISRIIQMPRSSALLVGVGGSGKQSLTRLAAKIAKHQVFQIQLTKTYNETNLKEDIKNLFDVAGHKGQQITFILTDVEVKQESFLEYINMVLSTGEIPGLIPKDDKEVWLGDVRTEYVKQNRSHNEPTAIEIYEYFLNRLRDNLHIVLCFSPVGTRFRERARKFPALFNECTIDWFLPWPEEALHSVAQQSLSEYTQLSSKPEVKAALEKWMAQVHIKINSACEEYLTKMRRSVFVTPKSYLSFIRAYKGLYTKKFDELSLAELNFKNGLQKIKEAKEEIELLEVSLKAEEEKVKRKKEEVEGIILLLNQERAKANKKNEEVSCEKSKIEVEKRQIEADKSVCEKELKESLPALEKAQAAANQVSAKEISDLKPVLILNAHVVMKYVVDAIQIVLYQKVRNDIVMLDKPVYASKKQEPQNLIEFFQDSWEAYGKQAFFEPTLAEKLQMMAKTENENLINGEILELLEPYTRCSKLWLSKENAVNVFTKMGLIHDWIIQIEKFSTETRNIKPKRIALKQAEDKLSVATAKLQEAETQLQIIQKKCEELDLNYKTNNDEKNDLEEQARKQKKKIDQANRLINSLSDERERWNKGANELSDYKKRLVGNVGLATAFISYCGPFNAEYRDLIANGKFIAEFKSMGIPHSPNIYAELTSFLVDEATIGQWNLDGLPKDVLSIQNGIMVEASERFPLLIDPQNQGTVWIKNKYREPNPVTNKANILCVSINEEKKFRDGLSRCIENGMVLIVEGVESDVDPILDPVLEKQLIKRNRSYRICLGGTTIDYDEKFKLFLTCKLGNPRFSPELSAKTTIIDFTVTQNGLEQQLLSVVLTKKQRVLEESLNALLREVTNNKKELKKLDETLLNKLSNAEGNLLDDESLVEILNSTKTQAKEMIVKLADAEVKTNEINEKRSTFRPVAIRGSVLYFCMIEIAQVNWMYNSSLNQFLTLYNYSIDHSGKAQMPSKDVENITRELSYNVYRYVNRGLFEKDKITFLLILCFKILTTDKKLTNADISLFLKAGAGLDKSSIKQKPAVDWITDRIWLNVQALSQHRFLNDGLPFFKTLPEALSSPGNIDLWKKWAYEKNDPESHPIPEYEERLRNEPEIGPFLRLCVIRCIREDRTSTACTKFIEATLGDSRFVSPETDTIESLYLNSSPKEPVLFLLSAGADPTNSIDELAKKKKRKLEKVSLGEGQEKKAETVISESLESGNWVLLQNCHLGLGFMALLDSMLMEEEFNAKADPEFRIWMSCEPRNGFPLGLLQKALKVTNEPPKGVKAGLLRTFSTLITPEFLERIDHKNWRSLLFTTCFLHSIVQERRKFGPLGWCIPYEFNTSDLEASLAFIEKYMNQLNTNNPVSQSANYPLANAVLVYMICQIQYGGRITDNVDREIFNAYGDSYFINNVLFNEGVLAKTAEAIYKVPDSSEHQVILDTIKKMPNDDNPEIFGLNRNADITFRLKDTQDMIRTIMETRPKDSGGEAGKTPEEIIQARAKEKLTKILFDYPEIELRDQIKKLGGPKGLNEKGMAVPLNIFLYQEIQMMRRILSIVKKTLTDIIEAVDGQIIMTPDIVSSIDSIYDGNVPRSWLHDPSGAEISWLKPTFGSWFDSLLERNVQLSNWLKGERPRSFNIGLFFNPQGFLTAMKQEVVRMNKIPKPGQKQTVEWSMDTVDYQTSVLTEKQQKEFENGKDIFPEGGVYIHGLFVEGAKMTKDGLQDSVEKKMIFPLNILHVTAVSTASRKGNDDKRENGYNCPLYKYPIRNDKYLIFRVFLNGLGVTENEKKWKLRGVALLCATDE